MNIVYNDFQNCLKNYKNYKKLQKKMLVGLIISELYFFVLF